jgi:hypothetical protein
MKSCTWTLINLNWCSVHALHLITCSCIVCIHYMYYISLHCNTWHVLQFITCIIHTRTCCLHTTLEVNLPNLFWLFWLSQLLSDILHHIYHEAMCFLFIVAIIGCVWFDKTIGAEGLTLKLLETTNKNFSRLWYVNTWAMKWSQTNGVLPPVSERILELRSHVTSCLSHRNVAG